MNIALCDDNQDFIVSFCDKVKNCYRERGIEVAIDLFMDGGALLSSDKSYDYAYIDIEMPNVDGMQVAKVFNKEKKASIIFVSNYENMVFDTFHYHPFWFLRKSRIDSDLGNVIDATIRNYQTKVKTIEFRSKGKVTAIEKLSNIMYLEVLNHTVTVHTINDNNICVSDSLSSYERRLKDDGFVRVHQSYLVNCDYIQGLTLDCVMLNNGLSLKLSKYRRSKIKEYYHDYIRRLL